MPKNIRFVKALESTNRNGKNNDRKTNFADVFDFWLVTFKQIVASKKYVSIMYREKGMHTEEIME